MDMAAHIPYDAPELAEALALQRSFGLVDLHVDSIIQQRLFRYDVRREHRAGLRGQPLFWHADVPRMAAAGYGGACMGIHYWPWESERGWREMHRQIDYLDALADEDPRCLRVREPGDWERAAREERLALAPGVEGAHMLAGRVERVAELARRGVAYLTLAHFSKNSAVTPSMGRGADERSGLTGFGRELVDALDEHSVTIDVAHVNTPGVLDICARTRRPVLCTHTGLDGLHEHARNISDEEIDAIAETGGAIGIIFAPFFLTGRLGVPSARVVDHIEYVIERVGLAHVCLGSDYDGWLPRIPNDQRDCRDIVRVTAELLARGHDEESLRAILRDNALRVLSAP
jgi:membrane dipeptidase